MEFPTLAIEPKLPSAFYNAVHRNHAHFQRNVLWINIHSQRMLHFEKASPSGGRHRRNPEYSPVRIPYRISTSRFGIGQEENTNKTPLGLHRIAKKVGANALPGTVFRGRRNIGYTWQGQPKARITDRILWLDGLESRWNRGGNVDTFRRYVYIHGTGDESTLGRPDTCGCTHLAARELIPIFDHLPINTLVWISER